MYNQRENFAYSKGREESMSYVSFLCQYQNYIIPISKTKHYLY